MIRVIKPTTIPRHLAQVGQQEKLLNQNSYDADAQAYLTGKIVFLIKKALYGSPTIKKVLRKAQHGKCCYCEKEQIDEAGAVEHYRPKGGYKLLRTERSSTKPGYYWLAYEWSNLYFICCRCNTVKSSLFPLVDETTRAKSHHNNIAAEAPYILDPGGTMDPRVHIRFDKNLIQGVTEFGKKTIEICKLNRPELNDKRQELLNIIDIHLGEIYVNDNPTDAKFLRSQRFLIQCQQPTAPFSAVAIDYLRNFSDYLLQRGIPVS
ncbi:hypothetical protein FNT36_23995 [Hymenobacter setariae]|jgi:uncharacterized protein (TIGR02646 family)|uniref:TIGR02646 family protein n=1 Tax=Hymenobacter setariae TaxID=2594794 RepID=A0A558BKC7_9BACT|nr:hypothetical protein [Hymenobacter setariae]TVT36935.1 hypothetical protein FNT36_23995 [Hymenobacter setariae]